MNRIRDLRTEHGMKQEDLAALLLVKRQAISKYELQQLDLDTKTIRRLCEIFHVTADYLLGFSSFPAPAVTEADAALLAAYHAATPKEQATVDGILAEYMEQKNTAAG